MPPLRWQSIFGISHDGLFSFHVGRETKPRPPAIGVVFADPTPPPHQLKQRSERLHTMPTTSAAAAAAAAMAIWVALAGPAPTAAADSRPLFQGIRDCATCVAVPGYGWCPLARRCSPGYPGKAGSCRGGETDFARSAVLSADDRLKEALQDDERVFNMVVLYHNLGGELAAPAVLDEWEVGARVLEPERDLRFYKLDCAAYATTCAALLPESEVAAATAAPDSRAPGAVAQFYAAGGGAGQWACPGGAQECDRAFPQARRVRYHNNNSSEEEADVASELARVRGFPLPKLEELAADFVRAAVMRSGDVDGDQLEQALLAKARALLLSEEECAKANEGIEGEGGNGGGSESRTVAGEYGGTPQQRAAGQHFINAMQQILKEPAGPGGRRMSALSRMGNQAASAVRGDHPSLESYIYAKGRDYAISSMTKPLLGR
jgi:hypothetical protein